MNKSKLMQYRSLVNEVPKLKRDIDKLYERLDKVPTVAGQVKKSSDGFPYTEGRMTVLMDEPKRASNIKTQIAIKERRLLQVEAERTEIERFIASIPDSATRIIFEAVYIDGETQEAVGEATGYSKGRISQIISGFLKH